MRRDQIALTTYTIKGFIQTGDDFARSMEKVAGIGYTAVQISGVGPVPAEDIRRICDDLGLTICATHEKAQVIVDSPREVADRLDILGTRYTAYPFPHIDVFDTAVLDDLIPRLDAAGAVLREHGKVLTYHNHSHEFYRDRSGRLLLDRIYDETDPENIASELDTYWVQAGGASPLIWIEKLAGRLPLLHLKDTGIFLKDDGKPEMRFTSVGAGNLDWPSLLAAADRGGTEWFIVEQDTNWVNDDPFEAAAASFRFLEDLAE